MQRPLSTSSRAWQRCAAGLLAAAAALVSGCGGGSDDSIDPASCRVEDRNTALRGYFDEWYFWYADSPRPRPSRYDRVSDYFEASLYDGVNAEFPFDDRWSYISTSESFNQFFGDGETLGYGVAVNGIELQNPLQPDGALRIRYVDPGSPADDAGLQRGDHILSINGRSSSDILTATNGFAVLSPEQEGDRIELEIAGRDAAVTLRARVYDLKPVPSSTARVVRTPEGRKAGYVLVKDMVSQVGAEPGGRLDDVFADFRDADVRELVLDLRYNGGGLVSVGRDIAAYIAGDQASGERYAGLRYNDRHDDENVDVEFPTFAPSNALGLRRVYVLAGPRTCSASEQVVNGLKPFVDDVVLIGDTTCGKPVGFQPVEDNCGSVFSVVNFESVNAEGVGRYFDGLAPTCAVDEDFTASLGSTEEPLLAAALTHADTGRCPAAADKPARSLAKAVRTSAPAAPDGRERPAMIRR